MRGLELNLASRPFRNNTLIWVGYSVLLAAGIGFTYWNVSSFRHYKTELARLDAQAGNIEQENRDLTERHRQVLRGVRNFDIKAISRRTTKANEVIEWRAFSWTRLFNRLEEMLPRKVRMTSVRPIFRDRDRYADPDDPRWSVSVSVEGLARDWDSFFEIQTKLIAHPSFGHVNPRFIEKIDNGEFAFSIEFAYYADEGQAAKAGDPEVETVVTEPPVTDDGGEAESAKAQPSRSLPAADLAPDEVTDEWAAQSTTEKDETAAPAEAKRRSGPQRRSLPQVEPQTDDSDEQGEPR